MKKILVTVVLGAAVAAAGQGGTPPAQQPQGQPAQAQPAAAQAQAPVIKDPAEYNAYVAAFQLADPKAKISGLEAFLTTYPNSVMKNNALEILMSAYQQTGNVKKATETAKKLVTGIPCQVPALFLLTYDDRVLAQGGDANGKQESADAEKYGQQGLDCLPKYPKPEGMSDSDYQTQLKTMRENFNFGIGWGALQDKDNAKAAQYLKAAVDANPPESQKDLSLIYPLALAYLQQNPPDYQNGIWYAAVAAAIAPPASAPGIEKYARSQYMKFHAGDDGWQDVLTAAKAGGPQVAIKPAPTPAEQAHNMVTATPPDKMDFAQWEFILSNGNQADQDTVWNAIKSKAVQMNGTVITASATEFDIAGSSDDIDAKKADIKLTFEDTVPAKLVPKEGASLDFQGEPASYTPNPFMMVMEKGKLLKAAAPAPAKKPPVHHKPAAGH